MIDAMHADNPLLTNPWSGLESMNTATLSTVQACAEACMEWQQEIARFSQTRLDENRRTWAALLASRDLASVMKVQQEWGLQAATDYTREATRLAQLATSLSLSGTTPAVQATASINA